MNRHVFGAVLIMFLSPLTAASTYDEVSRQYIEALQFDRFKDAASLLHLPNDYPQEAKEEDIRALAMIARIINEEFGRPTSCQEKNIGSNVFISLQTATPTYWDTYPVTLSKVWSCEFLKVGEAPIQVNFAELDGSSVMHSVSYGVPLSGIGAVLEISKRVAQEVMGAK